MQWHTTSNPDAVNFNGVPAYGRPIQYGGQTALHVGDGQLLSLVAATERTVNGVLYRAGPTRGSSAYAAKFVAKASKNGVEPKDCDVGTKCERRRTEVWGHRTHAVHYNAMPYKAERWMSISVFLPKDWNADKGAWGPLLLQVKSKNQDGSGNGPTFAISGAGDYNSETWQIIHRWSPEEQPNTIPWQYIDKWDRVNNFSHAAVEDFPNRAASEAALGNLNKGGWTDFVIHYRSDADGSGKNGQGFLNLYMHFADESGASLGDWVKVLEMKPRRISRGNMTFDRGVFYRDSGGYSMNVGMYMAKSRAWNLTSDRVVYNDNVKIGGAKAVFGDLSPDGSSPGSPKSTDAPPKPPQIDIR